MWLQGKNELSGHHWTIQISVSATFFEVAGKKKHINMALPENYEDTPNMWRLIIIFPIDLYELFGGNSTFFGLSHASTGKMPPSKLWHTMTTQRTLLKGSNPCATNYSPTFILNTPNINYKSQGLVWDEITLGPYNECFFCSIGVWDSMVGADKALNLLADSVV